jgi:hypothetical protein
MAIVPCWSGPPSSCTCTSMVESCIVLKNVLWKRLVYSEECLVEANFTYFHVSRVVVVSRVDVWI